MNGDAREAFRAGDLNGILIRRKGVRIHQAPADKEDEYFPCADCDPRGKGTRRDMCCFLVAFGAKVTIGPVCAHYGPPGRKRYRFIEDLTSHEIPPVKAITKIQAFRGILTAS